MGRSFGPATPRTAPAWHPYSALPRGVFSALRLRPPSVPPNLFLRLAVSPISILSGCASGECGLVGFILGCKQKNTGGDARNKSELRGQLLRYPPKVWNTQVWRPALLGRSAPCVSGAQVFRPARIEIVRTRHPAAEVRRWTQVPKRQENPPPDLGGYSIKPGNEF
jgi:hypothetical protein